MHPAEEPHQEHRSRNMMTINDWTQAVVADDGKKGGDCALAAAAFLKARLGIYPHVVHALDLPDIPVLGSHPEVLATARIELAERAESWMAERVAGIFGEDAGWTVELGRPASTVIRTVRSRGAQVVVIGPHEREGLFDFGSTQRGIFVNDDANIWSQPTPDVRVERVLAPFDFDEHSEEAAGQALELAKRLEVPLVVLHSSHEVGFVDPMPEYSAGAGMPAYVIDGIHKADETRFNAWCDEQDWKGIEVKREFSIGSPALQVRDAQGPADLVVMSTRGHTGLAAAFLGGVTYTVLKAQRGPVLALRR